jgi:hypothetical protein
MQPNLKPFCTNGCGKRCAGLKRKYCSLRCQFEHDFRLRALLIESGQYPAALQPRLLKKYLIRKYGERCSRCGWNERNPVTGKIPIEVEHIDGDWQNNALDNLALLCPNCHSLTPTFRGLNRGRGRAHRLGGTNNPLRGDAPRRRPAVAPLAPFPLPRRLAELVEPMDPTLNILSPPE